MTIVLALLVTSAVFGVFEAAHTGTVIPARERTLATRLGALFGAGFNVLVIYLLTK